MGVAKQELCGELTPTGELCNMPKGHSAQFHRYREYNIPAKWVIKDTTDKVLEEGSGRKELGYAMTNWLKNGVPIVIRVEPGLSVARPIRVATPTVRFSVPQAAPKGLSDKSTASVMQRLENGSAYFFKKCSWCEKDISGLRGNAVYCSSTCRSNAHKAAPCFYCGMPASEKEHVTPKHVKPSNNNFTVPTCIECNRLAGATNFDNALDKRNFIKNRIQQKYARILNSVDWTDEELAELGPKLAEHVRSYIQLKEIILERLAWDGG